MTSICITQPIFISSAPTTIIRSNTIKSSMFYGASSYAPERFANDVIGTTTVTFTGVHANSEIRVYRAGVEVAGIENCSQNHTLSWGIYTTNNDVTIVIVHQNYKIISILYSASIGNAAIPIQQQPDKWYNNPI